MTWIADLAPCTYLTNDPAANLVAIGWLDNEQKYAIGKTVPAVYQKLLELLTDCWQPFASGGFHYCNLCQLNGEAKGTANLFIPGKNAIYVCPGLITHYINAHWYQQPDEFCLAVLNCPHTRSMEYKRALLANGFKFPMSSLAPYPDPNVWLLAARTRRSKRSPTTPRQTRRSCCPRSYR
jgi:hypothetical protein